MCSCWGSNLISVVQMSRNLSLALPLNGSSWPYQDRRCLMAILDKYYKGEVVVHDESYKFSDSGIYYSPAVASYEKLMHYLDMLPPMDNPEVR
jgi:hypothetical protein